MRKLAATILILIVILTGCTGQTIYPDGHDDNTIRVNPEGQSSSWYLTRLRTAVKYGFPDIEGIAEKNEYELFAPELYIYMNYRDQGNETINGAIYHYQHLQNGTDLSFTRLEADVEIIDKDGNVLRTARAFPLGVKNRSELIINPKNDIKLGTVIHPEKQEDGIRIKAIYVTILPY